MSAPLTTPSPSRSATWARSTPGETDETRESTGAATRPTNPSPQSAGLRREVGQEPRALLEIEFDGQNVVIAVAVQIGDAHALGRRCPWTDLLRGFETDHRPSPPAEIGSVRLSSAITGPGRAWPDDHVQILVSVEITDRRPRRRSRARVAGKAAFAMRIRWPRSSPDSRRRRRGTTRRAG